MRIVFASYFYGSEFDDPEKWLNRIKAYTGIQECLSKQHTVISIEQINYKGELTQNGVHYYFLDYKKRKSFVPLRLHLFIKKLKPDIVLIHGLHFPLQVIQLRILLSRETKIIVQHHAEKPFHGYKKDIQRLADYCISAYLFTSVAMGEIWVKKGIIANTKKVWGIMEASSVFKPIDRLVAKQRTGAKGSPFFLCVGRLDENKDPLTVIKAFLQFGKYNSSARLYMIYHTTELLEKIQQMLAKENYNESVTLIGKVPHEEMLYWYNSADFIISGSHSEGSGIAVCESMSCGCIPVLTDILPFRKITANGTCGILYEKGNTNALFNALIKISLINVEKEREKVINQFRNDLSFEAIAGQINKKISGLYNKIT